MLVPFDAVGPGTSSDPCSENYRGRHPFSEPETLAMSNFLWRVRPRLEIYLSLHSYGQYWLTPWGFTYRVPSDYRHMVMAIILEFTVLHIRHVFTKWKPKHQLATLVFLIPSTISEIQPLHATFCLSRHQFVLSIGEKCLNSKGKKKY